MNQTWPGICKTEAKQPSTRADQVRDQTTKSLDEGKKTLQDQLEETKPNNGKNAHTRISRLKPSYRSNQTEK